MIHRSFVLILALFATFGAAFVPLSPQAASSSKLQASLREQFESKAATAAAFVVANVPVAAMAIVDDDYEYGAVDAPIGLAFGVGVLAIATAAVPVLMQGGEEAFEEMREREAETFGKDNKNVLRKK